VARRAVEPRSVCGRARTPRAKRAPGQDPNSLVETLGDHFLLFLPVEEVVVSPHCDDNRVQPPRSAVYCALANCLAVIEEAPM
jgi:hypothetical protein